jgi:hypothetical protein
VSTFIWDLQMCNVTVSIIILQIFLSDNMPRFSQACNDAQHARQKESAYNQLFAREHTIVQKLAKHASNNEMSPPFNTQYPPQVIENKQ